MIGHPLISEPGGYYGSNYLHDGITGSSGGKSVHFSPNLTSAMYDVYIRCCPKTHLPILNKSATVVGYSPSQFRAQFHLWLGVPPSDYARRLRLDRARQLLRDTDWLIAVSPTNSATPLPPISCALS